MKKGTPIPPPHRPSSGSGSARPTKKLLKLTDDQRHIIKKLKGEEHEIDRYWITYKQRDNRSNYIRIVRASEGCTVGGCHNVNGSAAPFSRDEAVGAIVVQTPARELDKTFSLNRLWIIVAGLLAGTGAVVTFYIIVQRVILRPVRQLRALVNNVAEGNLDVRSAIKTRDEYERLAEAFNKMLDRLQESQEKLRQANRQLDAKIVELSNRNIELFKANKIKKRIPGQYVARVQNAAERDFGLCGNLSRKERFARRRESPPLCRAHYYQRAAAAFNDQ